MRIETDKILVLREDHAFNVEKDAGSKEEKLKSGADDKSEIRHKRHQCSTKNGRAVNENKLNDHQNRKCSPCG